jgi:hypothetical protein
MNAPMKRSLVFDQDFAGNPGPPREDEEEGKATETPVQPPIQRPDEPPQGREPDPAEPTPNNTLKPIDRPDPGAEPETPGPARGTTR